MPELRFGRCSLVLGQIHLLPFPALDPSPNLCRRFLLLSLLVCVNPFPNADIANGSVLAREAIEQTSMPNAAIAMAVARLLVEDPLHLGSKGVSILHDGVFK